MSKKVITRETEWFGTYEEAVLRCSELRQQGWRISLGMMRAKLIIKPYYVRSWRWEHPAAARLCPVHVARLPNRSPLYDGLAPNKEETTSGEPNNISQGEREANDNCG